MKIEKKDKPDMKDLIFLGVRSDGSPDWEHKDTGQKYYHFELISLGVTVAEILKYKPNTFID